MKDKEMHIPEYDSDELMIIDNNESPPRGFFTSSGLRVTVSDNP